MSETPQYDLPERIDSIEQKVDGLQESTLALLKQFTKALTVLDKMTTILKSVEGSAGFKASLKKTLNEIDKRPSTVATHEGGTLKIHTPMQKFRFERVASDCSARLIEAVLVACGDEYRQP